MHPSTALHCASRFGEKRSIGAFSSLRGHSASYGVLLLATAPFCSVHIAQASPTSDKQWVEARQRAEGRVNGKKYKLPSKQWPDGTVAGSTKRLASRFYQLKKGPASQASMMPQLDEESAIRSALVALIEDADAGARLHKLFAGRSSRRSCGEGPEGDLPGEGSTGLKTRLSCR
jgi:hypothetical protein